MANSPAGLPGNSSSKGGDEGSFPRITRHLSRAAFTASKQEASKRLNSQLSEAMRLASGLRKLLEETYGVRSEKLAEYGLQPFRGRKVKGTAPEVPQKPEPPAVPTAPVDPNA